MFDDHGKRLGVVGRSEVDVERFLFRRCGVGTEPEEETRTTIPRQLLTGKVARCSRGHVRHYPLPLLDGSQVDFYLFDYPNYDWTSTHAAPEALELLAERCPELF